MKESAIRVRYVGVTAKTGYREYDFRIEDEDKTLRQVALIIEDSFFLANQLMFQEAPDLCYQKLKLDVIGETDQAPIRNPVLVTSSDISNYRESHPITKSRSRR